MSTASKPDPYGIDGGPLKSASTGDAVPASSGQRAGDPAFDVNEDRGIHVITLLRGKILDAREIETLGANLRNYFAKRQRSKVVLDMQAVNHLSSAALGMLVMLKSAVEGGGGKFALAGVHADLMEVFKMTKLHKVLAMKDNVNAAKASM
jgi:anti-sigma B factor antagonist